MEYLITDLHRFHIISQYIQAIAFNSSEIASKLSTLKIGKNSYNGSDVETKFNYPCIFKL